MKDKEKQLLKEAVSEIRNLRSRNQVLEARLSGFDDALMLLRTQPFYPGQACSPDVTYAMEKHIVAIEEEERRVQEAPTSVYASEPLAEDLAPKKKKWED